MSDEFVNITAGVGTPIATDNIGGIKYQRVKVTFGPDGTATDVNATTPLPVVVASLPLPSGGATEATLAGVLTIADFDTKTGSLTETAPATDTASSGLNGRLQRIAQRISSLIALLPTSLAANGGLKIEGVASGTAVPVSIASVPSHAVTNAGTFAVQATEADGANVTLGAKADAKSAATDTTAITAMSVWKQISASVQAIATSVAGTLTVATHAVTQSGTWTVQIGNTPNTTAIKVDGSAVTQPVSLASVPSHAVTNAGTFAVQNTVATPAGTNLIGQASASNETGTVYNGTTALTPLFATIAASSSGNNTIVAAVTSKVIRVLAVQIIANGAVNAKWQSGASGTDITGLAYLATNGGYVLPFNPVGWFQTGSNTLLNLNLSGAVAVGGSITYVTV